MIIALVGLKISAAGSNSTSECDIKYRANIGFSWETEQHADAAFAFYKATFNFSSDLAPGNLLYIEPATNLSNYSVPSGLTISRILYTTSNFNGTILPASAYVLWPYTSPNASRSSCCAGGYPIVAWAHDTSGLLRGCAPSNYRNLQYHFMSPFLLALQGMAVVAPDYAGLGVDSLLSGEQIGHLWAAGPAQANDLANAIIAARTAFPEYLRPTALFVAMGHSQGAGAGWALAQRLVEKPIKGYKGTAAIAPPTNLVKQAELAMANPSADWAPTILSSQPRLIAAVTAAFPSYNYSGMTPASYNRWVDILKPLGVCLPTDALVFSDLQLDELARDGWTKDEAVQTYSELIETGIKEFKGPLLILAGESDVVVPLQVIESAVEDTCRMLEREHWNESLELVTYSKMNHFSVIQVSQLKWLAWVKERLSSTDAPAKPGCVKSAVNGFQTEDTPDVAFPNFLEQWVSLEESWKYLL